MSSKSFSLLKKYISELLSESPKELFASDRSIPGSVQAWSLVEREHEREHERIKNLYPHDTDEYLPQQR